tara:strand:- start:385 stop:909 length:525 start_codon:yes stop_codon:yes gene_type:complete
MIKLKEILLSEMAVEITVERDKEGKMAKYDAKEAYEDAIDVFKMIDEYDDLPEWLEAKITKASDYLNSVKDYLQHHHSGTNEGKLTERRAQQARNWLDAVKLSRKGAGKKLQYKDKNRNPIYGNSMFYFQGVLYQVYPDDDVQGYVAYNKKRNKVRRLSNFFTSDWKKIELATG